VREIYVTDANAATQALAEELRSLVHSEGFAPGDIVILSRLPFAQSCTSALPSDLRKSITVLDESSPRNLRRHAIGFAEIADFKGLESEVVVLVDMPKPEVSETLRSLHYVGMSRARVLLSTICC
jgi:hypothetical protein